MARARVGTGDISATQDAPSQPLEGAADTADDAGHHAGYHVLGQLVASYAPGRREQYGNAPAQVAGGDGDGPAAAHPRS